MKQEEPNHRLASSTDRDEVAFRSILKATSLVGGSTAAGFLIGLVRVKLSAVLLGPTGVGLAGQFQQVTGLVSQITGLGVGSSGVREMALASSDPDPRVLERRYQALRRLTLITGGVGSIALICLAAPLATWSLGGTDYVTELRWLAPVVFLGHLAAGHSAIIQGRRRLKRLAALNVASALAGVAAAIPLYLAFGIKGVAPALLGGALAQFLLARSLAKPAEPHRTRFSRGQFMDESKGLVSLGLTFVLAGALGTIATFLVRAKVTQGLGLEAIGIYSAAWALSGLFARFVLDAMGADYVPQLTSLCDDDRGTNDAVNRQVEVGVLLSCAGLIGTQVFSSIAVDLLYDSRFHAAVPLLRLFTLAVFLQVLTWPIGYVLQARAHLRAFGSLQIAVQTTHVASVYLFIESQALDATAIALIAQNMVGGCLAFTAVRRFTGLGLAARTIRTAATGGALMSASFAAGLIDDSVARWSAGLSILAVSSYWATRSLQSRLGIQSLPKALLRR